MDIKLIICLTFGIYIAVSQIEASCRNGDEPTDLCSCSTKIIRPKPLPPPYRPRKICKCELINGQGRQDFKPVSDRCDCKGKQLKSASMELEKPIAKLHLPLINRKIVQALGGAVDGVVDSVFNGINKLCNCMKPYGEKEKVEKIKIKEEIKLERSEEKIKIKEEETIRDIDDHDDRKFVKYFKEKYPNKCRKCHQNICPKCQEKKCHKCHEQKCDKCQNERTDLIDSLSLSLAYDAAKRGNNPVREENLQYGFKKPLLIEKEKEREEIDEEKLFAVKGNVYELKSVCRKPDGSKCNSDYDVNEWINPKRLRYQDVGYYPEKSSDPVYVKHHYHHHHHHPKCGGCGRELQFKEETKYAEKFEPVYKPYYINAYE